MTPTARVTCRICGWHWTFPKATALQSLNQHLNECGAETEHPVAQLPSVTWHERALQGLRTLAATGRDFTIAELHPLAGDPVNPRRDWGRLTAEAHRIGLIVHVGWTESKLPTTKSSGVKVWRGAKAA